MKRVFFLLTVLMLTVTGANLAFAADSDTNEETHTLILRRINDSSKFYDYYWEVETEPGQIEEGMNIMGRGTIPLDRFDEQDTLFAFADRDMNMDFLDGRFGLTKELLLSDDFESIEITYTFDDVLEYSRYMNQELKLSVREDETEKEETHTLTLRRIDMPKSGYDYYFEVETEQGQIEEGMNLVGLVDVKLDFFDEIDTLFAFDLDDIDMEFLDGRYGITSELLSSDDFESMEITYTLDDVLAYGKYKKQKLGLTSEDSENEKAAEENINKSETEIYDSQEKFDSITKILMGISPIITHII